MLDLEWPYKRHADIFAGSQKYALEQDWESIIDEYADDTLPALPTQDAPYDGIIARATKKLAVRAEHLIVPVVNVWFSSPVAKQLPGVFPDFEKMGRLRAEHLLSRGFRRFATLTSDDSRGQDLEKQAFQEAVTAAGHECISVKVPLSTSETINEWRKTEKTISDWMDTWERPIGVYVGTESGGRVVSQCCRNRGWRVPEDVAIIAGHNEEALCEHLRPTLSSVEVGFDLIGYEAARLLDRLMDGDEPPTEPILIEAQGLMVRESTDFFAVEDPLIASALEFISANSHRQIGPDDVSEAVSTETRTLQRRFRKYLNRPIAAEIRRVRIERAKREIVQSDRLLSDIAIDVGFGEAMRMYEVFRRELGVTPSDYRKQRRVRGEE